MCWSTHWNHGEACAVELWGWKTWQRTLSSQNTRTNWRECKAWGSEFNTHLTHLMITWWLSIYLHSSSSPPGNKKAARQEKASTAESAPPASSLDSIMKVELLANKDSEEIAKVSWSMKTVWTMVWWLFISSPLDLGGVPQDERLHQWYYAGVLIT